MGVQGPPRAVQVPFTPAGSIAASNVQAAIEEVANEAGGGGAAAGGIVTVRVATTVNGTLASAFENGDVVDGRTLATGDRILIWTQSTASQNGIYTVNASGAPTRATDADAGSEFLSLFVYVKEGDQNHDSLFVCSNDSAPTIGTTAITFKPLGPFQVLGDGIGAIFFDVDTTVSSPGAWWTSGDNNTQLVVGDASGRLANWASTRQFLIDSSRISIIAHHTPADVSQAGLRIQVGSDSLDFYVNEKSSTTIQLWSVFSKIEMVDNSDTWQHKDINGVVRTLEKMENRKGSGTATVASGGTSITVTHGAGYTPVAQDILVCPTNSPTNDPGHWWVDTITSTQFTIHTRADPGASGAIFAWRVDR